MAGALAFAAPALGQSASFDFSPPQPLSGEAITFTSTSDPGYVPLWDLDGDNLCDDATGESVTHSFPTAGQYPVTICLQGTISRGTEAITVGNRPPVPDFGFVPAAPVAHELVTLTSTAVDPDGPIVAQEWDLDGDGVFDDATGETALSFWRRAGTHPVALRVTDRDGASVVARKSIVVAKRPPGVFARAPLIRLVGEPTTLGAHLSLLSVSAPQGANVGVRCKGGNCPYKRKRFTSKGKRVTLRKLARNYRAGTVIELRVTKAETIGTFTRIRIRAGRNPARLDRCLNPGRPNKPIHCAS